MLFLPWDFMEMGTSQLGDHSLPLLGCSFVLSLKSIASSNPENWGKAGVFLIGKKGFFCMCVRMFFLFFFFSCSIIYMQWYVQILSERVDECLPVIPTCNHYSDQNRQSIHDTEKFSRTPFQSPIPPGSYYFDFYHLLGGLFGIVWVSSLLTAGEVSWPCYSPGLRRKKPVSGNYLENSSPPLLSFRTELFVG